eukprot:m.244368 g.244368  ORF g.244368 m.244368 type:complete len:169 (+) comp10953_c0_seq19:5012-5518(+)
MAFSRSIVKRGTALLVRQLGVRAVCKKHTKCLSMAFNGVKQGRVTVLILGILVYVCTAKQQLYDRLMSVVASVVEWGVALLASQRGVRAVSKKHFDRFNMATLSCKKYRCSACRIGMYCRDASAKKHFEDGNSSMLRCHKHCMWQREARGFFQQPGALGVIALLESFA